MTNSNPLDHPWYTNVEQDHGDQHFLAVDRNGVYQLRFAKKYYRIETSKYIIDEDKDGELIITKKNKK